MQTATDRVVATRPYGQGWPTEPLPTNRLPVRADRHEALRAQLRDDRGSLADAARRDGAIDRALEFAWVNRLGLPTVKRLLEEVGVAAAEVDRVAAKRANNPNAGRVPPDGYQEGHNQTGARRILGHVTEPATRRLPFA